MTKTSIKFALVAAVTGGLIGCGGGSEAPAPDFYPLHVGDKWTYDRNSCRVVCVTSSFTQTVTGSTTVDGQPAFILDGSQTVRKTADGVIRYLSSGPATILKFPIRSGEQWTVYDTSTDFRDADGTLTQTIATRGTASVSGPVSVDTAAGRFDAYVVTFDQSTKRTTYIGTPSTVTIAESSTVDWYAAGVGRIRSSFSNFTYPTSYSASAEVITSFSVQN